MDAQSILHAAGPQASRIEGLWWLFLAVCAAVWVLVIAALVAAVARRRAHADAPVVALPSGGADPATRVPVEAPAPASERRTSRTVGALVAATALVLVGLLAASTVTGHALGALGAGVPLTIEVVGHQWWWEIRYADPVPSRNVVSANELHLPVGVPVRLVLHSRDVIHSLWVPALHGKKDLVPGRDGEMTVQADRPGLFRGQCAEFCGPQHAKMALWVVAEERSAFEGWLAAQREPARPPSSDEARRGHDVFVNGPCALCHRVQGTTAGATVGPDLTHLASRRSLGAGSLPNTRGHLAGWIANAQGVKPGSRMPPMTLEPGDLQALLTYLETLR